MRHEPHKIQLPTPVADGAGPAKDCRNLIDKTVQIKGGTYSFSIAIEFSYDEKLTWEPLIAATGAAVNGTEFFQPATHVRAVVSSFVSVTDAPAITLVGRNAETGP